MGRRDDKWGADTPISMPVAPDDLQPCRVDLGGFGFTTGGLCHAITDSEREEVMAPYFAPIPVDLPPLDDFHRQSTPRPQPPVTSDRKIPRGR
jgi:hypothetical protein